MIDRGQKGISKSRLAATSVLAIMVLLLMGLLAIPVAQAQTSYTMTPLYDFQGKADGANPSGGLIQDSAGNFYGTTDNSDGSNGVGVVFELSPSGNETTLYDFCNAGNNWPCPDGGVPLSSLLMDSAGNLYGTTYLGGTYGNGVVFELSPQPSGGCPANSNQGKGWCETVLYSFTGGADGAFPWAALVMDSAGNLYSTTSVATNPPYASYCGGSGGGSVFELSPSSGGTWTETTLHTFAGITSGGDGCQPYSGVTFDSNGNLYGVTFGGGKTATAGFPVGIAYELTPTSNGPWTETILYTFGSSPTDGLSPESDLVFKEGNLYGTTEYGGSTNNGAVFELSPGAGSTWTETILYSFTGGTDGCIPYQGVTLDPQGNMYGTTSACGNARGAGSVYELSPNGTMNPIWDFTGGTDGADPEGTVLRDSKGNLYGTSNTGALKGSGTLTNGAVWSLEPVILPTTTTVASSGSPSTYGQAVTFTATINAVSQNVKRNAKRQANRNLQVRPQDITGTVTWSANTGCGTTPVTFSTSGTATCITSVLPVGTDAVTASYSGDGGDQSSTGTLNQIVNITSQSITVTTPAPATAINGSSFTVVATASSGLPVDFASAGSCTNSGATYTIDKASGSCTVKLTQPGDTDYAAATPVVEATTVAKPIPPTVSFTGAPATAVYGSTFPVVATTNASTTAVITSTGSCTISGTTVTMTKGTGVCSLKAEWTADDVYSAASAVQKTTAEKATAAITWPTPDAITYGTALSATQLNATANVPGKLTYNPVAGKVLAAGTQTLSLKFTPTQTTDYTDATSTVQVVVNPISSTAAITKTAPAAPTAGNAVTVYFSVTAAYGHPTGGVTVTSSNGGPTCMGTLTLGKGTCSLTFPSSGFYTLTAAYSGDNNDTSSTSAGFLLAVN